MISLTVGNTTRSVTQWSRVTGISKSTIRYRHRLGWSPAQAVGLAPPPVRLRQAEQAASARQRARAIVVEADGTEIPRHEAAARLSLTVGALTQRLRRHRTAQGVARVTIEHLAQELGGSL